MSSLRVAGRVGAWLLLAASLAVLAATVVVPAVAGATSYAVLSGSMRPAIEPGDLVVVRPVGAEEVGVGSVITYQRESGRGATVTHRVVAVETTGSGERLFTTRGDDNDVADPEPVRPVQVRGELWYAVPEVGRLATVASPTVRRSVVQVLAGGLLAYAAVVVGLALRGRGRRSPRTHRADA